jgi:hypothetical protein
MKKLTSVIIFIFLLCSLFSLEIETVRNVNDSEFPLTRVIEWKGGAEPELELVPMVPGTEQVKQRFSEIQPEITIEKLNKIPLRANDFVFAKNVFLKLANIFGNPETQTKYLYESFLHNESVPLIEEAYICNERGRKVSPLRFSSSDIPGNFDYYQYLDEANFSGMVMKLSMNITDQYFYVRSINIESLKYGIFPVIPKESFFMDNFLFLDDEILYVYTIIHLKKDIPIKNIGPYNIDLGGMFGMRMDIMFNWIKGEFLLQ